MAERFVSTKCPASLDELRALLEEMFAELTGEPLSTEDSIFVRRHYSGGMPGGFVSTVFWREKGIPLLVSRCR
jgi:hypothetical protein